MRSAVRAALTLAVVSISACSGSPGASVAGPTPPPSSGGAPTSPAPPPSPGPPFTVTITASGMSPLELTVPVGAQVTFTNADSRPHDIAGGPDPSRPECPEIDVAGFLTPGQSRQTAVLPVARTCQYHDHAYIGVAAFQGRIVVR